MLLDRGSRGGINRQDAGELGRAALGGNTIAIAVDIQRALHEGIQQAVLAVEGHAFDAAVSPAVAVDGGEAIDRFGADRTAVLSLKQSFLAGGDVALDQIAGAEVEQADLAAVLITHRKHLAAHAADGGGEDGDGFRIVAEWVVGKDLIGGIHRDLILALQLRQARERRAIRTLQANDGQLAHRARGAVHAEFVDGGLKIGVQELPLAGCQRAIRTAIRDRVIDIKRLTIDGFNTIKPKAGEATWLHASRKVGGACCIAQGVGEILCRGQAPVPILDPRREDVGDGRRGRADVEHGDGVVLLQRDESRAAIGRDRDGFWFDVLRERGGHTSFAGDADAAVDQFGLAVVPGTEVDGLHIELGRSRWCCQQIGRGVNHGDRTDRIDRVGGVGLTLIGDQHLAAISTELHHVGQGADGDGADVKRKCGIGQVIELNKTVVGLDRVLHRHGKQLAEHRHALKGLAAVGGDGLGNNLGRRRIAQIAHHDRA